MSKEIKNDSYYWEATVTSHTEITELLCFYLFEEGAVGVEEIQTTADATRIKAFFSFQGQDIETLLTSAFEQIHQHRDTIKVDLIEKKPVENWQANWKAFFKPLPVGDRFVIRPPWEPSQADKMEIVIHPGLGFGTGYHESTRLALEMMEWLSRQTSFNYVIDVGTGSGILVIASLLLQSNRVTAIDIDEASLNEVPQNLVLSGFGRDACRVLQTGPHDLKEPADLVVANIIAETILKISDDLERLTAPNGYLLISGILTELKEGIINRFRTTMEPLHEMHMAEWSSLTFRKRQ
jgi:ribosomal protein L11 methyltransferase